MKIVKVLHAAFFLPLFVLFPQSTIEPPDDRYLELIENEEELIRVGEGWEEFRRQPIDIARPSYGDLVKIPFVSPMLAESIIQFTDTTVVTSIDQIRSAALMTDQLYEDLLPYLTLRKNESSAFTALFIPSAGEVRTRWKDRLTPSIGSRTGRFLGERYAAYQKIRIGNDHSAAAVVLEKDSGERFRHGFVSGFVSFHTHSVLRDVVIGSFSVSTGEGMVFGKNISSSKGTDAAGQIRRRGRTVSPVASADEISPFRGSVIRAAFSGVMITGLFSVKNLPASLDSNGMITGFSANGIYRTENDLNRRNRVKESAVGAIIDLSSGKQSLSLSMLNIRYNRQFAASGMERSFERSSVIGSISGTTQLHPFSLFGETATNDGKQFSSSGGIHLDLHRTLRMVYHRRNIIPGFRSPYAGVFAELSDLSEGESGNYFGVEADAAVTKIQLFADHFRQGSGNGFPHVGSDLLINTETNIARNVSISALHRRKKTANVSFERDQQHLRFTVRWKSAERWTIRQRVETIVVRYSPQRTMERGILTGLDLALRFGARNSVKMRFVLFDTPSYDSRLYFFESDVRGNFSNPPLYGKGFRWYGIGEWEVVTNMKLAGKYSVTSKLFERQLGSGVDAIPGNTDRQVVLQADFQF